MKQKTAQNTSGKPVPGAPLWIPAFAGMTKKDQSPRSHGFSSFSQNTPRHSREGGNPLGITVIHTGVLFLNQPNLPCLGPFFRRIYIVSVINCNHSHLRIYSYQWKIH